MFSFLRQKKILLRPFKRVSFLLFFMMFSLNAFAQHTIDNQSKGLFAIERADGSILVNWHWLDQEGDDTTFNLYRDGVLLNTSQIENRTSFVDAEGDVNSIYEVEPIAEGVIMPRQSTQVLSNTHYHEVFPLDMNSHPSAVDESNTEESVVDEKSFEGNSGIITSTPENSVILWPEGDYSGGAYVGRSFDQFLTEDAEAVRACWVNLLYCRDPRYGRPSACSNGGCSTVQAHNAAVSLCRRICGNINCNTIYWPPGCL